MRTSYLPNEILWGYRFEQSCVSYDQKAAKYVVSVHNLDKVVADNTPRSGNGSEIWIFFYSTIQSLKGCFLPEKRKTVFQV